jgi:hypothetical protein
VTLDAALAATAVPVGPPRAVGIPSGVDCARLILQGVELFDNVHVDEIRKISPVLSKSLSLVNKTNWAGVATVKLMLVSDSAKEDAKEISIIPEVPDVVLCMSINRDPDGYSAATVLL